MTYAGQHGHTLIDRRLYLPVSWTDDPTRMQTAGVPEQTGFAKRWELAADMITAAVGAQVPARWVAADEAYGNSSAFRSRLRDLGLGYVLAISCDHLVPFDGGQTRRRADHIAADCPLRPGTAAQPAPDPKAPASTTGPGSIRSPPTPTRPKKADTAC